MSASIDPREYLSIELRRLDLLLHREILRLRARYQLSLDEFRGLYISDEHVDRLIGQSGANGSTPGIEELTRQADTLRDAAARSRGDDSPWQHLAVEFGLSTIEQDILLIALAPEIDLKYETLYAYLNNDVTRKWPTCDLALRLLATDPEQRQLVRGALLQQSALFGSALLLPVLSQPQRTSWLAGGFSAAPTVSHFLSRLHVLDPRLAWCAELHAPAVGAARQQTNVKQSSALRRLIHADNHPLPLFLLTGRVGAGRYEAAAAACEAHGLSAIRVDLEALCGAADQIPRLTQALQLEQRLLNAGLYLERGECLFETTGKLLPGARHLLQSLEGSTRPVFVASQPETPWREHLVERRIVTLHFRDPDYATRLRVWENSAARAGADVTTDDLAALADRFIFTPGQIAHAVRRALDTRAMQGGEHTPALDSETLFAAARVQSGHTLGQLAVKVKTIHTWDDLVLPDATLQRIREIAAAIKFRHLVYSDWGYARQSTAGTGLKTLFSGDSGTGKTMTAAVIARELGLELYKIDLSGIVSKYIGETEKNLDRIFRSATCSNAILFFDEADALFGKRSEVKEAHDRYANIEVAYLLQKIEEFEGIVILASNLSKNIDQAFSRRMHYVVDFPLPAEEQRIQLWTKMFPQQLPVGKDLDLPFLARQFTITGGDIRNVTLDAAFLAAQNGRVVTMKLVVQALARQMTKQGRVATPADFKQYYELLGQVG